MEQSKELTEFYLRYNEIPILSLIEQHNKLDTLPMDTHIHLLETALTDQHYSSQEEATQYLLEYYLRSGAAYFFPPPGDSIVSIAAALESGCHLCHVMLANIVRTKTIDGWVSTDISQELLDYLRGDNVHYLTVAQGPKQLYPQLNRKLHAFVTKPPPTRGRLLRVEGDTMFERIRRHRREYQTVLDCRGQRFMVVDSATFKSTIDDIIRREESWEDTLGSSSMTSREWEQVIDAVTSDCGSLGIKVTDEITRQIAYCTRHVMHGTDFRDIARKHKATVTSLWGVICDHISD